MPAMTPLRKLPPEQPFPAVGDLLLSLVNHLDAMVAFWDANQTCVFANAAYSSWFGKSGPEVVGLTMRQLLGPDLYAKNQPHIEAALRGERQVFERSIPVPGGAIRHSLATYFPYVQDGRVLGFFAHVADVSPMKKLQDELEQAKHRAEELATHDFLTGLPNRVLLMDRLEQALANARRRNEMMAVMSFDVDEFKAINDRFGHAGGDRLLVELAHRAGGSLRDTDSVTRLGGDEFLVVATRIGAFEQIEAVARRLVTRLGEPFLLEGQWVSPSISLGVALYPEHGRTPEALIAKSDAALYLAKHAGKGRYAFAAGPAA
jgi:diguanylate cyclase (GGDEF)-like protein/PAS domain S-box-containing protein